MTTAGNLYARRDLHAAFIAALFFTSAACSSGQASADDASASGLSERVFVYRDTKSELFEVFDFDQDVMVEGGSDLQRDPGNASSEFSGPIDACTDARFFCLTTGLHIAIPRTGTLSRWTVSGMSCDAAQNASSDTFSGHCTVNGRDSSVRFLYSTARGLLSFSRVCRACRPEEYVLIGERGMFARNPG